MPERTFTTHDIARFCDVNPSTIQNWINSGKLKSYQTAGGHHRVTREELTGFLSQLNVPIPNEVQGLSRVLIVDDDEDVARVIAKAFARLPEFAVEVCGDGVEALIRIGQEPPDLVVLDVVLPKMDGIQVCKVLKSQPQTRDIKIVVVTGKRLPFSERRLEEAGVDALFRKPLDLLELTGKCSDLLKVRR